MNVMQSVSPFPGSPCIPSLCIPLDDPILSPGRLNSTVHDILAGKEYENCSLEETIIQKAQIIFRAKALSFFPSTPPSSIIGEVGDFQGEDEDRDHSRSSSRASSAGSSTASSAASNDSCSSLDEPGFVAVIINHPETRQELSKYFAKCSKEQKEVEALVQSLKDRYHERGFRANRWKCVSHPKRPSS
jgi:hypothetical protein